MPEGWIENVVGHVGVEGIIDCNALASGLDFMLRLLN
jgi:hypothetical protein